MNRSNRRSSFLKYFENNDFLYTLGPVHKCLKNIHIINKHLVVAEEYSQYLNNAYATLFITDNKFKGKWFSWRLFEAYKANCICFIDEESDPNHILINDSYFYVNNQNDLNQKISQIMKDENLRKELLQKQRNILDSFDIEKFKKDLENHIANLEYQEVKV